MYRKDYRIEKNALESWFILHPTDNALAWSGSRWVAHYKGMPAEDVQVCNFATQPELHEYAILNLERIKRETFRATQYGKLASTEK